MEKLDLTKKYLSYYKAKKSPELLSFGLTNYLSILGKGDPNDKEFGEKVATLYPLAYGVKAICKSNGQAFIVPKLEGLWWIESDIDYTEVPRSEWRWKLLIRMPDFADTDMLDNARETLIKKKKEGLFHEVNFESIEEGDCVQILHLGSFSDEEKSLEKIHEFMKKENLSWNGYHHEIYLSDFRKTAQEKLKTILRQPVKKSD